MVVNLALKSALYWDPSGNQWSWTLKGFRTKSSEHTKFLNVKRQSKVTFISCQWFLHLQGVVSVEGNGVPVYPPPSVSAPFYGYNSYMYVDQRKVETDFKVAED